MKRVFYSIGIVLWLVSWNVFAATAQELKVLQLNQEASHHYQQGDYPKALEKLQASLSIIKKAVGEQHPATVESYASIGEIYRLIGNYSLAMEYNTKAQILREKFLGEEHPDTAASYNNIGATYRDIGNHSKAEEYFLKSLTIRKKVFGDKHVDTAVSYHNLGSMYRIMGNYSKALEHQRKAIAISEEISGKEHPETATSYNNISVTYGEMGNHLISLQYLLKAVAIREKVLGEHPSTATSYTNIGSTYRSMYYYPKALEYQFKALSIVEKILGKQHPRTAHIYHNIGLTYSDMGDHPKALEYEQKVLAIRKNSLGIQHPDTAQSYADIGLIYNAMSNHPKALEYQLKALAISEKIFGKSHIVIAGSYNNIGATYGDMKNYAKALEYERKTLAIAKEILGEQHPNTAVSYSNIGLTYQAMNDYPEAQKHQFKALAIMENIFGKQHPETSIIYNNIGSTYDAMSKHSEALTYRLKALAIREKVLGKKHPKTALNYNTTSVTYGYLNDYSNAYKYAKKAFTIFLQQRDSNFTALNDEQKRQYLTANESYIHNLLLDTHHYLQYLHNKKEYQQAIELARTTINDWLAYKGSILDSENRLIQLAKTSRNSDTQDKYQQLVQFKKAYSKLHQSYPKEAEKIAMWQQQLKQQEEQIAVLERQIIQSDPRFKNEKALQTITSQHVANGLTDKELYIDYGKTNDGYYLFTIDHNNQISFSAFNKKDSKAITQQLALFNTDIEAITDEDKIPEDLKEQSQANLSALYQLLIPPTLAAKIATKESLIISPDGGLRLLPFEALYDQANKQYLIQQKDIRYIASGKELVRLFRQQKNQNKTSNDKAVLFANPDFNKGGIKKTKQTAMIYDRYAKRGKLRADEGFFKPLSGTKVEAEAIIDILQKTNVRHYYYQDSATEANLLTVKQPSLLHIATHGFFNADTPNPMLQSGLAFAGANIGAKNGTGGGIVTALDLSGLDLKGTDLVVLSACDTGKVDPNNTNGVSGLTKAFIQAGAKDVVMSLWQVNDEKTADLMTDFYKTSVNNQHQYSAALKQSKLAMIKDGLHPYYWSAFVLHGL